MNRKLSAAQHLLCSEDCPQRDTSGTNHRRQTEVREGTPARTCVQVEEGCKGTWLLSARDRKDHKLNTQVRKPYRNADNRDKTQDTHGWIIKGITHMVTLKKWDQKLGNQYAEEIKIITGYQNSSHRKEQTCYREF